MTYKLCCFFIIIFTVGFQPAEVANPAPKLHLNINRTAQPDLVNGFTNYKGTTSKNIEVVFSLSNLNGSVMGCYFLQKKGINIALTGSLLNNNLKLYELDAHKKQFAIITGKLNKKTIIGNWKNLKSNNSLKLTLTETAKKIPSLPKHILGNYKNSEDTKCKIKLSI